MLDLHFLLQDKPVSIYFPLYLIAIIYYLQSESNKLKAYTKNANRKLPIKRIIIELLQIKNIQIS